MDKDEKTKQCRTDTMKSRNLL